MPFDGAAELPRVTPARVPLSSLSYSTTVVCTAANLQSTINARAGISGAGHHEIIVQDGELITNQITLPARNTGSSGYIVIRSQTMPCTEGIQAHPSMLSTQAEFRATTNIPAIRTMPGVPGCDRYILAGLNVKQSAADGNQLIAIGDGSSTQNSLNMCPNGIILDRCVVQPRSILTPSGLRRAVALHSATVVLTECWLAGHYDGADSQAIYIANGPGPIYIDHNYLEGSGETIMCGGQSVLIPGVIPSDITITRNVIAKPRNWKGAGPDIKNLIELKMGRRVLIEGNVIENNWADAQTGYGVLIKSVDQNKISPWVGSTNVTVRKNFLRNVGGWIVVSANPEGVTQAPAAQISVHDNIVVEINADIFTGTGRMFEASAIVDLAIQHNTAVARDNTPRAALCWIYPTLVRAMITDNIDSRSSTYGLRTDSASGSTAWTKVADAASQFTRNVLVSDSAASLPPGNWSPANISGVGFTDPSIRTRFGTDTPDQICAALKLASTSAYKGAGAGGSDPGADTDAVRAAIAGVWVPGLSSDIFGRYTGPGPAFSDGGGTPPPTPVLTTVVVTPASASVAVGGNQQFNAVGYDQFGNTMAISPTWSAMPGAGTISSTGLFTAGLTAGSYPGAVAAVVGAVSDASDVTVTPAPPPAPVPTRLAWAVQPSATNSGDPFSPQPAVQVLDQYDNPINDPGLVVTASVASGAATLSGGLTATVAGNTAAWVDLTPNAIATGLATLRATAPGLGSVDSDPFQVAYIPPPPPAPTPTSLAIGVQPTDTATGVPFSPQPTVRVKDQYGNFINDPGVVVTAIVQGGDITLSGGDSAAVVGDTASFVDLTPNSTATVPAQVRFSAPGLGYVDSQIFQVGYPAVPPPPPPPAVPVINSFTATPDTISGFGDTLLEWNVTGADSVSINQGIGDVTGLTQKSASLTQTKTFTLTATNAGGSVSASITVTVTAVPVPAISAFTATPASVLGSGAVLLEWTVADAVALSIDQGVGDVTGLTSIVVNLSSTKIFTLAASNPTGLSTAQVTVTVTPLPPPPSDNPLVNSVVVTPATTSIRAQDGQQFIAKGYDYLGNELSITPVWEVSPGVGTITQNGVFVAGNIPGTYSGAVRATVGTIYGSADVVILDIPPAYPPPPTTPITRRGICGYYTRLRRLA